MVFLKKAYKATTVKLDNKILGGVKRGQNGVRYGVQMGNLIDASCPKMTRMDPNHFPYM